MVSYFLGIDIGKTNLRVGIVHGQASILYFEKRAYSRGNAKLMDEQITAAVDNVLAKSKIKMTQIAAIGVGVPAIVDRKTGEILSGPDLDWWQGSSVTQPLVERYDRPVIADVDSVVATWGELWAGCGRTCNRFALITWGTGLGAGLVLDGGVYEGPNSLFAEFGHSVVSDDDRSCICGARGCICSVVTGPGIALSGRLAVSRGESTNLRKMSEGISEKVSSAMVFEAAGQGDKVALKILDRVAILLGRLCSNIVCTIQPEKIVIVGGLSDRAEWILERINRVMCEQSWLIFKGFTNCEVVASTLRDTAGVLGAARLAKERFGL